MLQLSGIDCGFASFSNNLVPVMRLQSMPAVICRSIKQFMHMFLWCIDVSLDLMLFMLLQLHGDDHLLASSVGSCAISSLLGI